MPYESITITKNKKFTLKPTHPKFNICNISLNHKIYSNERTSVLMSFNDKTTVLCNLIPKTFENSSFNIEISEIEEVNFMIKGDNDVDLLYYYEN